MREKWSELKALDISWTFRCVCRVCLWQSGGGKSFLTTQLRANYVMRDLICPTSL